MRFNLGLAAALAVAGFALLNGCAPTKPTADINTSAAKIRPLTGEIKDCNVCPEMVVIPPGEFMMGATPGESGGVFLERPKHHVRIERPFALGKYEVTFAEWDACVDDGGCTHRPGDEGWGRGNRPVINVSWLEAQAYVRWLSAKTNSAYRLPSESEWEYAARAKTKTERYWGNNPHQACRYANVGDQTWISSGLGPPETQMHSCTDGYEATAPVGQFRPNGFGLFDMLGNVWEWTEDCWNSSYKDAPVDGSAWMEGRCDLRIGRGGGFNSYQGYARAAARVPAPSEASSSRIGFRVAKTLGR